MALTPIGFPARHSGALLRDLLTELKARADIAREEAVTGRRADLAGATGGRVAETIGIERALAEIGSYREAGRLAAARATTTQTVIDGLRASVDGLVNDTQVALETGTRQALETASDMAKAALDQAVARLSTTLGGRSLFSGDAGDRAPLVDAEAIFAALRPLVDGAPDAATAQAALAAAFDTPGGLFETVLYTGGTGDAPDTEIAPGERVDYQARADEPAIRDLLRGIATIALAQDAGVALPPEARETLAANAVSDLRAAAVPLNGLAARIGTAEERIATLEAERNAEEAALTAAYNDRVGADQLTAAATLSEIEGQLETLFLTTARLSALSLANFLR